MHDCFCAVPKKSWMKNGVRCIVSHIFDQSNPRNSQRSNLPASPSPSINHGCMSTRCLLGTSWRCPFWGDLRPIPAPHLNPGQHQHQSGAGEKNGGSALQNRNHEVLCLNLRIESASPLTLMWHVNKTESHCVESGLLWAQNTGQTNQNKWFHFIS